MIGSEHLSHLLSEDTTGGRVIGEELTSALTAAHRELGVTHVRAHAILGDDLGVYREPDGPDGEPVHDFTGVDRVYDHLRGIGLYPVVELSFMPHDLASDPGTTVFEYAAIVSPPRDWDRWHDLIRDLVAHLADRYGLQDLVDNWSFEVWNEANLEVFWSGTPEEYLRLYDVTAAAVKSVDSRLRVGGPSSAASGWVEELLAHAERTGVAGRLRHDAHLRQPAAGLPADAGALRPRRQADLVDRVGRHADALQRGQRRRLRGHVPAARDGVVDGPPGGAVLLGGLRPLRGARPPAGPAARRLRAAHGRRAAQAALVGPGPAGAPRDPAAGRRAGRRRRRLAGRGPGCRRARPGGDAGRRGHHAGLEPHPRPDQGIGQRRPVPSGARSTTPGSPRGRRTRCTTTGSTTSTATSPRSGDGSRTTTRTGRPRSSGPTCGRPTGSRPSSRTDP